MPIQLQCSPNAVPPKFDFWDKDGKNRKMRKQWKQGKQWKKKKKTDF